MKTIKNPNVGKLNYILLPIFLVITYTIFTQSFPLWATIVCIVSLITYMGLFAYFCIKQKCYTQLVIGSIIIIVWVVTYLFQFHYLDKVAALVH